MSNLFILPRLYPIIGLVASCLPLLALNFPLGHDWICELVRVAEYKAAFTNGQLLPYWGENLYSGYGSPIFLFYAPLFAAVASFCSLFTSSVAAASAMALILFSLAGVLGMKLLLDEALWNETDVRATASRIAATFFILSPYLLADKIIRNANSEYAALCLTPFAIYGLLLISRRPKAGIAILSLSFALVITAHNLTALIVCALLLAAAVFLYSRTSSFSLWTSIAGSLALGLGLSAFFWFPAMYYKSLVHIDEMIKGKFDFHTRFAPIDSFFSTRDFFSAGPLIPVVVGGAFVLLCIAFRRSSGSWTHLNAFALTSCLILFFLQTKPSIPLWENIPFMPLFQFPWRFMGPIAVLASISLGLSVAYVLKGKSTKIMLATESIIVLLCIINALPHLTNFKPLPSQIESQLPYMLKSDTIKLMGQHATILEEYLPHPADPATADKLKYTGPLTKSIPGIDTAVVTDAGKDIVIDVRTPSPVTLEFSRWFFPGWECTINGAKHPVGTSASGFATVTIPSGSNHVSLHLGPPKIRRVCTWISLAFIAVWGVFGVLAWIDSRRQQA